MPVYPDRHEYKGTTMHSIEWSTGDAWAGKRGIVIGTGSTGHDVAKAMVEGGLSEVTMIQRNVTPYFLEEYCRTIFDPIYDGHSDIGQADRVSTPVPAPIARVQSMAGIQALAEKYSERFDELEKTNLKIARCFDMQHQFFEVSFTYAEKDSYSHADMNVNTASRRPIRR
jgi:cation diffusion facilitator CzcD-associated flavoprotein CzcO